MLYTKILKNNKIFGAIRTLGGLRPTLRYFLKWPQLSQVIELLKLHILSRYFIFECIHSPSFPVIKSESSRVVT